MSRRATFLLMLLAALGAPGLWADSAQARSAERGAYIFAAAGCAGCHTDIKNKGQLLAGGRALETPFGTYFGPNITADREHGIGGWSDADFIRAMRDGVSPDGGHYYPVFPYPSFTLMTDGDMRDLKAYIFSLPTAATPNKPHEIRFPFRFRFLMAAWKLLFFEPGAYAADGARSAQWNRGAYIVRALGHCGECHTPRNVLGAVKADRHLSGTKAGPDGEPVPNITPHRTTGIGGWTGDEIAQLLRSGETPLGDEVDGEMWEVVKNGTSKLTSGDLAAVADYLKNIPAIAHQVFPGP